MESRLENGSGHAGVSGQVKELPYRDGFIPES